MCLQRSPSVARWPSGTQRAHCSAPGNATRETNNNNKCLRRRRTCNSFNHTSNNNSNNNNNNSDIVLVCVSGNGCVVIAAATTAPRARALVAACLAFALAALCVAARCYATSTHHQQLFPSLHRAKRSSSLLITTTDTLNHLNNETATTNSSTPSPTTPRIVNSARVREYKAAQVTTRPMPSVPGSGSTLHEHQLLHKHPTNTVSGGTSYQNPESDRSGSGGGGGGGGGGLVALVVGATLLTATLGLITCVVSHYRAGGGGGSAGGVPPPPPPPPPYYAPSPNQHPHQQQPCITVPMLSVMSASAAAGVGVAAAGDGGRLHRHVGVARELAAQRDRQVRLHSVHTDLELDLPPSIALPDGEELPYGSSARLHIRDPEQESEIYQKCIRAPPNRTVFESESPPPYRSSSAGLLGSLGSSSSSGASDWSAGSTPLVVRCHSMSSSSKQHPHTSAPSSSQKTDFLQRTVKILTGRKSSSSSSSSSSQPPAPAPTLPVVVVPTRPRRLDPRSPHV